MVSPELFSIIVWGFGPVLALVGAIVLVLWLMGEVRAGYYRAE